MRLLVGHSINWDEPYGVIEDIQDYNLDKSMAAASLLDDVAELITIARQRGGAAKMILALETEQGSTVVGAIEEIEQYDLTRSRALRQAGGVD
jgi:predicted transglutaminase-like cysteine proteinase